jgi:ATP-dependent Lhr-like helicase
MPSKIEPATRWLQSQGMRPFRFQLQAWREHLAGRDILIHSSTGSGKTLAAWLGPLLEWIDNPLPQDQWLGGKRGNSHPPLTALWITPLRALAQDTEKSLRRAIEGMNVPWQLESRTSDTSSSVKQRQKTRMPTALVTTPESLTIMLSYAESLDSFGHLRTIVIDEWHELLGSKRGVLLELALARLRVRLPNLRTIGISATLGNLNEAKQVLVGESRAHQAVLVQGNQEKKLEIKALLPQRLERFPWAGHLGIQNVPQVADRIHASQSTLVFTNTRNQCELWYQSLLNADRTLAGQIAIHHGSLESDVRHWVEDALRDGKLRAVVCTSSLDLGVDFSTVDQVVQVGSPKGIARLLQRAGRSGHQPGSTSKLLFVPTNALELIELAAARTMMHARRLEARDPIQLPLDVLVQHLVTRGLAERYDRNQIMRELQATHAFRHISESDLELVIQFAKNGGDSLARYAEYHRLAEHADKTLQVTDPKIARDHRMAIGTIVSDVAFDVRYMTQKRLGSVEESFASKLKPGDRFLFAGKVLQLVHVHDSVAWVKKSSGTPNTAPRWMGGRMPLSSQLSAGIRMRIEEASLGKYDGAEMKSVRPILELQNRWSKLPNTQQLLIEQTKTREGYHCFVFPFEGRLVHEGLSSLFAYRLSRTRSITFSIAANDYGFLLQSPTDPELTQKDIDLCLALTELEQDILAGVNATEMVKRQFREVARIAGLIRVGPPGWKKSGKHLQASSELIFGALSEYDPGNLLLAQARKELLENQLEWFRMCAALERMKRSEIVWTHPAKPTPFSFSLLVDRLRDRLSTEKLIERVQRMQSSLERDADSN